MKPANSSLFGLHVLGAGTRDVESLRSYVRRLAYAHDVSPARLVSELLAMCPLDAVSMSSVRNAFVEGNISGKGDVVDALLTRLQQATFRDLQPAAAQRFGHLFAAQRFCRAPSQAHCPECVKDDAWDGLPYGRLLWELSPITCCPVHHVRLVDSKRCGEPGVVARDFRRRPLLSGVCASCGSIGFACRTEAAEPATAEEIWIANQMSALVALSPQETFAIAPATMRDGIVATVEAAFGGEMATAAVECGLGRTSVLEWVRNEGRLPSLDTLLKFCWRARADLLALLHGRYERSEAAGGVRAMSLAKRKYSLAKRDWERIRALLIEEAEKPAPRAVGDIASELGMWISNLRLNLPEETNRLAESSKRYQAALRKQKYEELKAKFSGAAQALASDGIAITKTNVIERSGIQVFGGRSQVRHAALRDVLADYGVVMPPTAIALTQAG